MHQINTGNTPAFICRYAFKNMGLFLEKEMNICLDRNHIMDSVDFQVDQQIVKNDTIINMIKY